VWLARPKVHAQCAKVGGTAGLWCAGEDIGTPGDLEPNETGGHDRSLDLCIQQSAGNSASPEIYLAFRALGNWPLHQDIADL